MTRPPTRLAFAWQPFLVQSQLVGMLAFAQYFLHSWTDHTPVKSSFDKGALYFLLFAAVNLAMMLAGDRLLRRNGLWRRAHYLALGALASTAAHGVALAPAAYLSAFNDGILVWLLLTPMLIGAAAAFLMHKSLRFVPEGDEPATLAQVAGDETGHAQYDIGTAEYYDGPLQVRTSAMAAGIAALAGGALYVFLTLIGLGDGMLSADATPPLFRNNPVLFALYGIVGLAGLFYVFIRRSHGVLQRRGKSEMRSYVLAGLYVPLGFALALLPLLGPLGILFVLPWIPPSMAAMAIYYRHAGMEPLDLPDDIEVRDPRALVGADHIRRRTRRVIRAD